MCFELSIAYEIYYKFAKCVSYFTQRKWMEMKKSYCDPNLKLFELKKYLCKKKLYFWILFKFNYRKVSNNGRGYYYVFTEFWSDFSTKVRLLIEVRLLFKGGYYLRHYGISIGFGYDIHGTLLKIWKCNDRTFTCFVTQKYYFIDTQGM